MNGSVKLPNGGGLALPSGGFQPRPQTRLGADFRIGLRVGTGAARAGAAEYRTK